MDELVIRLASGRELGWNSVHLEGLDIEQDAPDGRAKKGWGPGPGEIAEDGGVRDGGGEGRVQLGETSGGVGGEGRETTGGHGKGWGGRDHRRTQGWTVVMGHLR